MPLLPQVAMSFVRILYQFWLQQGISKEVLDDVLRIDINDKKSVRFGISSNCLSSLHQAANNASSDAVMAIRLGRYVAGKDLELEKIITYSENLYRGLNVMVEYSQVISESGYFTLLSQDNGRYALKFTAHDNIHVSSQQQDMAFSAILAVIEKVYLGCNDYIRYHYDLNIACVEEYRALLSCSLVADHNVYLEIDPALLTVNNPQSNSKLFAKSIQKIEKIILKRQQRLDLYMKVSECIEYSLLAGNAHQEEVAEQLDISVRNLQRRLKETGTSYQSILDDSRERLALKLIQLDELPLYEIAYKVGFTEPSAFYKAFRRWTGKRPGDYRRDVLRSKESQSSEALTADVSPC